MVICWWCCSCVPPFHLTMDAHQSQSGKPLMYSNAGCNPNPMREPLMHTGCAAMIFFFPGLCGAWRWVPVQWRHRASSNGGNKSAVMSSKVSHFQLKKCHTTLTFHCTREAILASNVITFEHIIPGKNVNLNPTHNHACVAVRNEVLFHSEDKLDLIE